MVPEREEGILIQGTHRPCSFPSACTSSSDTPDTDCDAPYRPHTSPSLLGTWKRQKKKEWFYFRLRKEKSFPINSSVLDFFHFYSWLPTPFLYSSVIYPQWMGEGRNNLGPSLFYCCWRIMGVKNGLNGRESVEQEIKGKKFKIVLLLFLLFVHIIRFRSIATPFLLSLSLPNPLLHLIKFPFPIPSLPLCRLIPLLCTKEHRLCPSANPMNWTRKLNQSYHQSTNCSSVALETLLRVNILPSID